MEADLGTFPPPGSFCLSGVSSWLPKRRGAAGSLGDECLAPVLLLRILILLRFDTTTSAADGTHSWHQLIVNEAAEHGEKSGFTFVISGEGKAGHCLQAVGAAHHQRTGAPFRLGGAGGGPRAKATGHRNQGGKLQNKLKRKHKTKKKKNLGHTGGYICAYLAMRPEFLASRPPSAGLRDKLNPPTSPRSSFSSL